MSEATKTKKKLSIPVKLAIALVLGAIAGLIFKEKASYVAFIGSLFIRLLKMCVYPLVLFSIIAGIANVADIAKLKKIGGQFLLYTFITSAVAGVLGCIAITISGAGTGLVLQATVDSSVQQLNMVDSIVGWVPDNVFASLANGTLVQIIVFAIFFGVMITKMRKNANTVDMVAMVVEGCNLIMQRMVANRYDRRPLRRVLPDRQSGGHHRRPEPEGDLHHGSLPVGCFSGAHAHRPAPAAPFLRTCQALQVLQEHCPRYPDGILHPVQRGYAACDMEVSKEKNGVPDDVVDLCAAPACHHQYGRRSH